MSSIWMLALKHDRPKRPTPQLRRNTEILREISQPKFDVRDVFAESRAVKVGRVSHLVIDPGVGSGTGGREPIYGDPGEDFVVRPRVTVGPVVELLVDPGEQGDRAVGETVAEGLGLGALDLVVSAAFFYEPPRPRQACLFVRRVGRHGVLQCQGW